MTGKVAPAPRRTTAVRVLRVPGLSPAPERGVSPYPLAIASFGFYALISVLRFRRVENPSWDLAIFEQGIKGYAHLGAPIVDVRAPGMNQLGDHFSPINATIAPFYRLFPSPVTLLVAQALLFALAVVPVTRIATRFLGPSRGLAVGVAYALSWGVQRAVAFDFHEIAFAVPLIALVLEKLLLERWTAALLWCFPLLFVKEDMGLTVAAVGVYMLLQRQWWRGAVAVVGGLLAVVVTVAFVIPAFNPAGVYEYTDKSGGGSAFGILSGFPRDLVWPYVKVETLLWTFGVVGFLALRSPLALIAVPTLAWRMLSETESHWSREWHYSATVMPIVFVALVDGIRRAGGSPRPWLRTYVRNMPVAAAAAALALCATLPVADLIRPNTYRTPPNLPVATAALSHIRAGSTVETDLALISQLPSFTKVFWYGATGGVVPDYIAVAQPDVWDDVARQQMVQDAADRHGGARYEIAFAYGFVVLERVG